MSHRSKDNKCYECPKGYTTSQGLMKHMKNVHQKITNILSSPNTKTNQTNDTSVNSNHANQLDEDDYIMDEACEDQDLYDELDNIVAQFHDINRDDMVTKIKRFKIIVENKNKIIDDINTEKNKVFEVHQYQARELNNKEIEIKQLQNTINNQKGRIMEILKENRQKTIDLRKLKKAHKDMSKELETKTQSMAEMLKQRFNQTEELKIKQDLINHLTKALVGNTDEIINEE